MSKYPEAPNGDRFSGEELSLENLIEELSYISPEVREQMLNMVIAVVEESGKEADPQRIKFFEKLLEEIPYDSSVDDKFMATTNQLVQNLERIGDEIARLDKEAESLKEIPEPVTYGVEDLAIEERVRLARKTLDKNKLAYNGHPEIVEIVWERFNLTYKNGGIPLFHKWCQSELEARQKPSRLSKVVERLRRSK